MKIKLSLIIAIISIAIPFSVIAQRTQLPTVEVNGESFYYYDVQPKETIFSISQRLGLSRQQIIDANPSVADGLQAYTRLYFPVESGEITASVAPTTDTTHKVTKGETLYGISRQYGITVDDLIRLNPSARDGVKSGDILTITVKNTQKDTNPVVSTKGSRHVIAQGETLYRIAADNGITVEQLLKANPQLDALNYATGTEIIIPGQENLLADNEVAPKQETHATTEKPQTVEPVKPTTPSAKNEVDSKSDVETVNESETTVLPTVPQADNPSLDEYARQQAEELYSQPVESVNPELPNVERNSFDVAVMLPFMLNDTILDRPAQLYTDFYRGFMLATQELSSNGKPIRIHAFDTAGNNDSVTAILNSPVFKEVDLVVGPDNEQHLATVIANVDKDSTWIFNPFVVRNNAYTDHSNVIQANIPQEDMYDQAAEAYIKHLEGRTPVFIARKKGLAEKQGFVTNLKAKLTEQSIAFEDIVFNDALLPDDIARLDSVGSYVFIPCTGHRSEFLKFKDTLLEFGKNNPSGIMTYGYPDWTTFRGDMVDDLNSLNTFIYSRFYFNPEKEASKRFIASYVDWYGTEPVDGAPLQAALGYDTAMYLLKSIRNNGGNFDSQRSDFKGIQNNFYLSDSQVEGLVNTSLLLIHFSPDGTIKSIEL